MTLALVEIAYVACLAGFAFSSFMAGRTYGRRLGRYLIRRLGD